MRLTSWLSATAFRTLRSHFAPSSKKRVRRQIGQQSEQLELRTLLTGFSEAGATLSINILAGETVSVVSAGTTYTLTSSSTWSGANSARVSGNGSATLTVTAAGLAAFDTVSIGDTGANATVNFNNSGANTYTDSFTVILDDAAAGAISFNGTTAFVGSNSLSASTTRNIVANVGAAISTVNGGLTLSANAAGATAGAFDGINFNNASVTTSGIGNISLTARGGNQAGTGFHRGVLLQAGAIVQTTATGLLANQGQITINGTGGSGTTQNYGVWVLNTSRIRSTGNGKISVTGQGGNGTADINAGVVVSNASLIEATGAGTITINGKGGTGDGFNYGVLVYDATVRSATGLIDIDGEGNGGAGNGNAGFVVQAAGVVTSTTGPITIEGTGGAGADSNYGIWMSGSSVISSSGDIGITAQGGTGTGSFNVGILHETSSEIKTTGDGGIAIDSTGGVGINTSLGAWVRNSAKILSADGDISITSRGGTGNSGNGDNYGIAMWSNSSVIADGAGGISIDGKGGGFGFDVGVWIANNDTKVTTTQGDILIAGHDSVFTGVLIHDNALIESLGVGAVTLDGRGTSYDNWILGGRIRSKDGDINITGTNGVFGLLTQGGGSIATTTAGTADITIRAITPPGVSSLIDISNDGSGFSVDTSAGTGVVNLIADNINIRAGATINVGPRTVSLLPEHTTTSMTLGGDDAPNVLGLTDDELDRITAGTLMIGDTNTNGISFSGNVTRSAGTNVLLTTKPATNIAFGTGSLNAGAGGDVTLTTSGSGAITTGDNTGADITGDDITLNAGSGGVGTTTNFVRLDGSTVVATTAGNAGINLAEADSITIAAAGLNAGTGTTTLDGGTFAPGAANVIPDTESLVLNAGAVFNLAGQTETINGLSGAGTINNTAGTGLLNVGANGGGGTFSGVIQNTGGTLGLTKVGAGTLILTNAANTYGGVTNVNAGTLLVNGSNLGTGAVNVNNTATLGGSGTIVAAVTVGATAHLAPGNSPGIINTGDLVQNGILDIDLAGDGGPGDANGHDQVNVTGSVTINPASATLVMDITGLTAAELTADSEFTIINNNLGDVVVGTFSGLSEGATVISNVAGTSFSLVISYRGDSAVPGSTTGNDVILRCVAGPPVFVDFAGGNLFVFGTGHPDDVTILITDTNIVTLVGNAGTHFVGLGFAGGVIGPFMVTGDITAEMGNDNDKVLLLGAGAGGGTFDSGNIYVDLGTGDDIFTTTDVAPPLTPTTGVTLTGDLTIRGGEGSDTLSLGNTTAVNINDTLTVNNLSIDNGDGAGAQSVVLNRVTVNGNATIDQAGNGLQTITLTGTPATGSSVAGSLRITQNGAVNTGGYVVGMTNYRVVGDLTIANGDSTVAVGGAIINVIGNIVPAPVIGGRTTVSNGNNLLNDINVDPMVFSGDASFTNGDSQANSIDIDDTTFTATGATITFTNGSGANNDINLGVNATNTFAGQVFAFNNSAVAGTNDITIPQGVFSRNVTLTNGLNAAAGIDVDNTVTLANVGAGMDVTGNVVITNANTSTGGVNAVTIGGAGVAAGAGLRVIQVTPANGSGSGNLNVSNGMTADSAATVSILGVVSDGTVAGSTNAIDGNISVKNSGSTAGGTKQIDLSGLATFGRTGATLNNALAGDSITNIGGNAGAVTAPVYFNRTGGLFVQDGAGTALLNVQLATVGSPNTPNQLGFRYSDMGGGADTINISTLPASSVTVNGVTRLDTAGGSDTVTVTRSVASGGGGSAAFNDSFFGALGAGDDTLNVGAFAASPAFGSAAKFQFDGAQGVNTINASPLSISHYTVGNVPRRLKSKITSFRNINGAL